LFREIFKFVTQGFLKVSKAKFKGLLSETSLQIDSSTYSLMCDTETNVLSEIRINYDLDFNRTSDVKSTENCPDNFQIYFMTGQNESFYEQYNYYSMSLTWLPTYCKGIGEECYNKLKEKDLNIMFLNGLWPVLKNSLYPLIIKWCNLAEDIQVEVEKLPDDLYNNMTNYWVSPNSEDKVLWTLDYNMHGYCFSQRKYNSTDNYTGYFTKAMEIFIDGDLKELLKDIIPGYIYGEQKVEKSLLRENLQKRFGGVFGFKCIAYNNNYYLSEITLFYNFTYKEAKDINNQENCTEDIYVEFIEYESRQEQDKDLYKYYDMYYFTILWLPTSCLGKVEECKKRIEQLPVKNNFTLHGLWPSYQNGTETYWCNGDNDIKIEIKDKELLDFMNDYYTGSYHSKEYLWGHEYNKHGYCYNQRKELDPNEYEYYFKK